MKKCLVTGANGLLGRELITLLSRTHEVYSVSRTSKSEKKDNVIPIKIDLARNWNESKLPKDIELIYLLAQSNHHQDTVNNSADVFDINVRSIFRLIDFYTKNKVNKIVLASTGGVYVGQQKPLSENSSHKRDLNLYTSSKLCSEYIANTYKSSADIIIMRPFFIYGAGQKDNFLIPKLINSIRIGKPIILQGKNGIKLNPIYVKDAAMAFYKSAKLKGSFEINIAGKEILTIREIANAIGNILRIKPVFQIQRKGTATNIIGSINLMEKILYVPKFNFKDGILDTIKNEKI